MPWPFGCGTRKRCQLKEFKFSIIIPAYNRGHCLKRCLDSVVSQTYKNFEVIIVDDGSVDNTHEVLNLFQSLLPMKILRNEKPSGGAWLPRKQGIEISSGEYLAFLDSDDWWYPNKLKAVNEKLNEDSYDVIYHNMHAYDDEKNLKVKRTMRSRKLHSPVFIDLMTNHNTLITSSVVISKASYFKTEGFREGPLEDWDLWLRLAEVTDKFYFLSKVLGAYWEGGGNTTQVSEVEIKRLEQIFERFYNLVPSEFQLQAKAAHEYIKGRIYFKMSEGKKAQEHYLYALKNAGPYIKLKALINLIILKWVNRY